MPAFARFLEEPFPKTLSIDTGAKHSFKSYEALKKWVSEEMDYLDSIGFFQISVGGVRSQFINELKSFFINNNQHDWTDEFFFQKLKKHIEEQHKRFGFIDSRSKEAKWLNKLKEDQPLLLNGALQYFLSKRKGNSDNNQMGLFHAYMYDQGIEPNFETERKQYEDYFNELEERKTALLDGLDDKDAKQKTQIEEFEALLKSWMGKFKDLNDAHELAHADLVSKHEANMKKTEDFYEKKLAFKQAVTYWSDKATGHKTLSIWFGSISAVLMVATLIGVFVIGNSILHLDSSSDYGKRLITDQGALQLWVYGLFIVSITLIIWLVRLLVKVFLSNLHLQTDANERATMIQTYLALEREENVLKPEDKELILPSIFRTTSTGIVKDDGSPNTPLNVFMKQTGN